MNRERIFALFSFAVIFWIGACTKDKGMIPGAGQSECPVVTYTADIKPITTKRCISCHSGDCPCGSLETYDALKEVADNGELREHVLVHRDMPPDGKLAPLQYLKIRCWLDQGAPE